MSSSSECSFAVRSERWYSMAKRCVSSCMVPMRANTAGLAEMPISSPSGVTSARVRWRSSFTMPKMRSSSPSERATSRAAAACTAPPSISSRSGSGANFPSPSR